MLFMCLESNVDMLDVIVSSYEWEYMCWCGVIDLC